MRGVPRLRRAISIAPDWSISISSSRADRVIHAARILSEPCGPAIDSKAITISTAGVVPMIRRFTAEGHPYRLIVSLTTTNETLRVYGGVPFAVRRHLDRLARSAAALRLPVLDPPVLVEAMEKSTSTR